MQGGTRFSNVAQTSVCDFFVACKINHRLKPVLLHISKRDINSFKGSADFSLRFLRCLQNQSQAEACATSHQQTRYQFCSSLHSKLDKDVTQMKLDRLLTDSQSLAYIGICKSFNTAKRHLSFTPA